MQLFKVSKLFLRLTIQIFIFS